jgi:hypothetical protein
MSNFIDDAFDVGPTPPPWALPGAQPNWDDAGVLAWTRDIGDQVWIACEDTLAEDGGWVRSPAVISFAADTFVSAACGLAVVAVGLSAERAADICVGLQ